MPEIVQKKKQGLSGLRQLCGLGCCLDDESLGDAHVARNATGDLLLRCGTHVARDCERCTGAEESPTEVQRHSGADGGQLRQRRVVVNTALIAMSDSSKPSCARAVVASPTDILTNHWRRTQKSIEMIWVIHPQRHLPPCAIGCSGLCVFTSVSCPLIRRTPGGCLYTGTYPPPPHMGGCQSQLPAQRNFFGGLQKSPPKTYAKKPQEQQTNTKKTQINFLSGS